ncbi:HAD-IIB family hydrolase [Pectobacterium punjabense]|uniref:HAD-IIB family hydrolase n=1 Tax=Pectobacterium punjabense TaxID=2108399 RepID=UPI001968A63D|nr:HAD-IIB family hydrolase [Pectobacterium punjabense]MBN3137693.1 HAD-IIB family hydrolase [Pectobacterium punjabense]MCE5379923.1 HAD-IIB family hydrolase [Pectobacterium punjabense]
MIKLVITDLDGTFLHSDGDYNRVLFAEVYALMKAKGIQFVACTGKQCERVEALFGDDAKDIWILGDSATRIKHQGDYVYQSLIKNCLALSLIGVLESIDDQHVVIGCTPNGAMVKETISPDLLEKIKKSYTNVTLIPGFSAVTDDFVKITVYDPAGHCYETAKYLDAFHDHVYIVVSEAAWIDIANVGVHKGHTVEILQDKLAITAEETMVFGDGYNDIELMSRAAYSFAMRNAFEETKAAANFIARSNDDDGVLKTIKLLLS